MNNQTDHLDQPEEDVLTYTVSDEALEAAANAERRIASNVYPFCTVPAEAPTAARILEWPVT
jgi:hypothetical protein